MAGDGSRGDRRASSRRTEAARLLHEMQIEPLGVQLAGDMVDLCSAPSDARLADLVDDLRHRVAFELGLVLPPVRFGVEPGLVSNAYRIVVDGSSAGEAIAPAGHVMVVVGDGGLDLDAIHCSEPVFGLPVAWIPTDDAATGTIGSTVTREQAIVAHLGEIARQHAPTLLTRDGVAQLVDAVRERHPASTEEIDTGLLPLSILHAVLRDLLATQTSIRNLRRILDDLGPAVMAAAPYADLVTIARRAVEG